jgi:hypothetical protein
MNEMVIKSWDVIIINHTSEPSKFGNRGKNRKGEGGGREERGARGCE